MGSRIKRDCVVVLRDDPKILGGQKVSRGEGSVPWPTCFVEGRSLLRQLGLILIPRAKGR